MIIMGDVHGQHNMYWKILKRENSEESIQLGDFGFKKHHDWHIENMDPVKDKILFGNHDYYPYLDKPYSMGDFTMLTRKGGQRVMTIRGAWSIDQAHRLEGHTWFREEEMTMVTWNSCIDAYEKFKPHVVISHDAPFMINKAFYHIYDSNRTSMGLDTCFNIHQPVEWYFGHHHKPKTQTIERCTFRCLGELEFTKV